MNSRKLLLDKTQFKIGSNELINPKFSSYLNILHVNKCMNLTSFQFGFGFFLPNHFLIKNQLASPNSFIQVFCF
jgi:hypothetical protein